MYIQIPVTTEVIERNADLCTQGQLEDGRIVIEMDTRKRDYKTLLDLPRGGHVEWINERTFAVQELSSFAWPIVYRITTADGYYHRDGERVYFTPEIAGLSTQKKVSDVVVRLAVFLSIIAGLGCRKAAWLMGVLFGVVTSKSAIDRWIAEVADSLPSADDMIKLLNRHKPVSQGHLDEIFPCGTGAAVLVLKDEHGRIITAQAVEQRDEAHVTPFLQRLKRLGLAIKTFYIDGWQAYSNSIELVYPDAQIQWDYFHILQNVWKHVWKAFTGYRKQVKVRSAASRTPRYAAKLKQLATDVWKNRYLFFKSDARLTTQEKEQMPQVLTADDRMGYLRRFLQKVWSIFEDAHDETTARQKLEAVKRDAADQDAESGFAKAVKFLDTHFEPLTTFLRVPGVQRNSLAESGMRVLRRLEQSHDGFRSDQRRENALKIYQAVMYLGWSIHDPPNLREISVS
jgi:hypothetical protein